MKIKVNFSKQINQVEEISIKKLYEEYQLPDDIFTDEEPETIRIKEIIYTKLSETDRRIILLYAHLGSQRKLGELLGVSAATINHRINEIRREITKYK